MQAMAMVILAFHHRVILLIHLAEEVDRKTLDLQEEELQMLLALQGLRRFWLLKVLT